MSGFRQNGYRVGDKIVQINGRMRRLRLTVSSLAEMASVFDAKSPKDLADHLRNATAKDWTAVLHCVTVPPLQDDLRREELVRVLPILSVLITEGLRA